MSAQRILTVAIGLFAVAVRLGWAQVLPPGAIAEINHAARVRVSFFDLTTARLIRPRADSASIAFQRVVASSRIGRALTSPLPLRAVRTIEVPHGTHLASGLVVGTAVGVGLGLAFIASGGVFGGSPTPGETAGALTRGGVAGAVVGAAIGLLFTRWQRVFPVRE